MKNPRPRAGTTASGPSHPAAPADALARHAADQQKLAAAMPVNKAKAAEYGADAGRKAAAGITTPMPSASAGSSTLTEGNRSPKTGAAATEPGAPRGDLAPL